MADKRPISTRTTTAKPATAATAATATTTTPAAAKKETVKKPQLPLFEKENFIWMGIGAVVIAIGMMLMSGGKSTDPNHFDANSVYSTTRITIAPILILAGFAVEIYAIFKRPKAQH
jgi:hypothetical protein